MEQKIITPQFEHSSVADLHFRNLRLQVNEVIDQLPAYRKWYPVMKAFLLPALYFGMYAFALVQTWYPAFLLLYLTMGLTVVVIFVNLIHDACHHTLFEHRKWNRWYMLLFDLMGANSHIWRKRHVRLHHNYPNIAGWDSDIEKSDFLKVHPGDDTRKQGRFNKFIIFIYPLFVLNWFLFRDFRDYFTRKTIVRKLGPIPKMEYVKLIFFKALYLFLMVVVPCLITPFTVAQVIMAWLGLMVAAGLFGLVVLLPPHVNIYNQFPVAGENGEMGQSWLMHQLITTNDVNGSNWFNRHVMANFNCHLIHHLFPKVNYVYAGEATRVLKDYCRAEGLPYRSLPLFTALKAHFQLIIRNQSAFDIFEEDM